MLQHPSSNSSYGVPTFIKIKAMHLSSIWDFVYEFDVINIQHLYPQISQRQVHVCEALAGFFAYGFVFISNTVGRWAEPISFMSLHNV